MKSTSYFVVITKSRKFKESAFDNTENTMIAVKTSGKRFIELG